MASSASLGLTLRLLPAPTAAVVAAGLGLDLISKHYNPALAFSYGQPYDDDVFQKEARLGTEGLGGDSPALEQVEGLPLSLLSLKTRPIGWDAWHFLSSRRNILITLIRNEGVSTLLVLNAYFAHLYEEEERADREGREPVWPAFPRRQMSAAARRGLYNSAIDYTVQCTRAVLDLAAVRRLPPALSSRLVRDLRAAVARAAALPWHRRAPALLATSLLSEASLYAADAAVAACVEAWGAARWYGGPAPARARRLVKRVALHALRGAVALAAVSLGNALGSLAPVARGLVMFAAAQGGSMLANAYMGALLERLTPDTGKAPGGGAPAPAGALAGPHPVDAAQEPRRDATAEGAVEALGGALARLGAGALMGEEGRAGEGRDGGESARGRGAGSRQDEEGEAGGAEPPVPAPQERRAPGVGGGPRLPARPVRRGAAAGSGSPAGAAAAPAAGPAGPPTPQFREPRHTETEEELGAGSGRSAAATPGAQPAAEAEEADELAALVSAAAVCNVMLANDGFVGQAPSLG
ncbi:hypothetical protein ACKKBG_A07265 [Auxenochlorella protothecoides x Auxenochlorella symbiontica]